MITLRLECSGCGAYLQQYDTPSRNALARQEWEVMHAHQDQAAPAGGLRGRDLDAVPQDRQRVGGMDQGAAPVAEITPWVKCTRCEMPWEKAPPGIMGAASIGGGEYLCKNGRDCVLRYKRKRRAKEGR